MVKNGGSSEMYLKIDEQDLPSNLEIKFLQPKLGVGDTTLVYCKVRGDKTGKYGFIRTRVKFRDENHPDKTLGNFQITYSQKEDFKAWTNEARSQAPGLKFTQTTVNFGTALYTEKVTCEFNFSNPGKSDLIIRDIKLSSFVEVLDYDERVPAGGKGSISFKINLEKAVGDFIRYVTVITNCPTVSTTRLTMEGKVVDK